MGANVFKGWHLIVLILLVVVLFGWKKLPDASRSLARSLRIFKSELTAGDEDQKSSTGAVEGEVVNRPVQRPESPVRDTERR